MTRAASRVFSFHPKALVGALAVGVLLAAATAARASEPKVRGAKGTLRIPGEPGRSQLGEPGTPLEFSLPGPADVSFTFRAIQPGTASGPVGTAHVLLEGTDVLSVPLAAGHSGRFIGRRDLAPGPPTVRVVHLGEPFSNVSVTTEGGAIAVLFKSELAAAELAPLVAGQANPGPAAVPLTSANEGAREPPLRLPPPSVEPLVPLAVDAPAPRHPTWPYYTLVGTLAVGFASGVVWVISKNEDNSYKSTPESVGREAKRTAANNELVAAETLGGVAIALLAASAVGLAF